MGKADGRADNSLGRVMTKSQFRSHESNEVFEVTNGRRQAIAASRRGKEQGNQVRGGYISTNVIIALAARTYLESCRSSGIVRTQFLNRSESKLEALQSCRTINLANSGDRGRRMRRPKAPLESEKQASGPTNAFRLKRRMWAPFRQR